MTTRTGSCALVCDDTDDNAGDKHGYTQFLAARHPAQAFQTDVGIRLAEKFGAETEYAVKNQEQAGDHAGGARCARQPLQGNKQQHAFERELRRLAAKEPVIANVVAQSDERRIAYLVRLFRSELGLDSAEALARARVQHAFFVGAQMVFPEADARFRLNLQKTLGATLWRK